MFFPPNYSILLLKNKKREMNEKSDKYELFLKEFVSEIARIALEKEFFISSQYIEDINYEYEIKLPSWVYYAGRGNEDKV